MRINSGLLVALLLAQVAIAQNPTPKNDVRNPAGNYKEVTFSTNEGTWMSLDVSPDGQTIVFDLLGDIYSLPITGGKAKLLRGGHSLEVQPRFSPDGSRILFTSDAGGGDNIWVMNADGSAPKQITKEDFRLVNNAAWTPDGQYIVTRKHYTGTRSLGAGEIWMYHHTGGSGLQLTKRKNDQQDVNEPIVSPDGRYVYYSEDMYPGGYFQYNKDPNNQIFVIKKLDRQTGDIETVTGGAGGAFRPQISRDGKKLAFIRRVRTQTVLYIKDVATGEEWPVYDQLSKDQQEAWTIFGIYPGFAWTPTNDALIIWSKGKIHRIDIAKPNQSTLIPFEAAVSQRVYESVRFAQKVHTDEFEPNIIRDAVTSPDGKTLVFTAIGQLWKKQLPDGQPIALTEGPSFSSEPNFTADGKTLFYVTWTDKETGAISSLNLDNPAQKTRITTTKGIYRYPHVSKDGTKIVYQKEGDDGVLGYSYTVKPGIYWMDLQTKEEHFVQQKGEKPRFNASGTRIFFQTGGDLFGDLSKTFGSVNLDGQREETYLKSKYAAQFTVSPNEQMIAFVDLHKVYVGQLPKTGRAVDISADTKAFPVKQIAKDAGSNLHWSQDNTKITYTLGNQLFTIDVKQRFEQADSTFNPTPISIGLKVKSDKPQGRIAFTNATIITMKGDEVLTGATILIDGNQIAALGKGIKIPEGTQIIDAKGKTIMPGLIDAHAHGNHFRHGITPQKHWPYFTNLAYGVTTMHDPSAHSETVFTQSELIKAGKMIGPRVFSTGTILYGADGDFKAVVNSLEDARSALRRTKAMGAFSVKSYNQPRREQRQWIVQAARELEMMVVPEGGSFFMHNYSMILDGHTTIEHNIPVAPLYKDVQTIWKNAKTAYTPTLIVNYGGVSGEYYWYQHTNVWEKERLLRFTPRSIIDSRSRHRTMLPEEEYENGHIQTAKSAKLLNDQGVLVNIGAHGQIQGIGAHWEIWMMAQGGMSPHQALKTATINPAKSLGFDQYIGSLEVGKLADLLVLDKNPLLDIKNTESIKYTMINGHLYEAETMNEIGNSTQKREPFYWENTRFAPFFKWHDATQNQQNGSCICGFGTNVQP